MKKLALILVLLASAAFSQTLPGIQDSQKTLPGWLSDPNFITPIFNGVSQNASATITPITATESWTVMFWVNRRGAQSNGRMFSTRTGPGGGLEMYFSSTAGAVSYYCDATSKGFNPGITIPLSAWNHLTITYSPYTIKTYLNSALATVSTAIGSAPLSATWGINGKTDINALNGSLAEMSIWGSELSQADIQKYYNKRLKGNEPGIRNLWHMNDNAQVFQDSVSAKNATITGSVPWVVRRGYVSPDIRAEKYALSFDGTDDYASATSMIAAYPFTLAGWVFTPTLAASKGCWISIANNATSTAQGAYVAVYNSGGTYTVYGTINQDGTAYSISSTTSQLGKWAHLAFSCPSETSRSLYINGVLAAATSTAAVFPTGITHSGVGAILSSTKIYGFGRYAEVCFWTSALTQAQIQNIMYLSPDTASSSLVGYYPFKTGTGTTENDLSAAGKNMTLYNSPTWTGRSIP